MQRRLPNRAARSMLCPGESIIRAMGSNRLIQQGAKLVTSAQDILDDFGLLFPKTPDLRLLHRC